MRFIITSLILFLWYPLAGQFQSEYQPLHSVVPDTIDFQAQLDKTCEEQIALLPKRSDRDLKDIFKSRCDYIRKVFQNNECLVDDRIDGYFQFVLKEITSANPDIPAAQIRLYINRSIAPNATCLGDGTIFFNIGLIRCLNNESQIAFVLCHELAHQVLNHVNTNLITQYEKVHAKSTRQEIKEISKTKYGKMGKATDLLQNLTFDSRRHSRLSESQADSLAMIFLNRTRYESGEALTTLGILDTIDRLEYVFDPDFKKTFNTAEYPFKPEWLNDANPLLFGGRDGALHESIADSLKTHPDCSIRIQKLSNTVFKAGRLKFLQDESRFRDIVRIADLETVEGALNDGDLGNSLYHAIRLLSEYPDNAYLHAIAGKCLLDIRQAQVEHVLGKSVEQPAADMPLAYQKTLRFIYQLRAKEISRVAWFFLNQNKEKYLESELFLFQLARASALQEDPALKEATRNLYMKHFPAGKYASAVKGL